MPLSDVKDPVIREVRRYRREVRLLRYAIVIAYIALLVGLSASFYIRTRDLEAQTNKANTEQVRTCFRSANQRADIRLLLFDPLLSDAAKDFIRLTIANMPTLVDCRRLADELGVSVPEVNG